MNTKQQRAAFEAYIKNRHPYLIKPDDMQAERDKGMLLTAWIAAIALDRQGRSEPVAWMTEDGRVASTETRDEAMPNVSRVLFNIPLYRHPQPTAPVVKESLTVAEPVDIPAGWKEQFKAELYDRYCAMDNQDFPLEDYPAVAMEVLEKVVGPRHPTVIRWRNDAITQCIAIAYKYCRDPESHRYLKQDLEALLTAAPQPAEPVKCQDSSMGDHACNNRSQCWEPCGELGHSAEHARVAEQAQQDFQAIRDAALDEAANHCESRAGLRGTGAWYALVAVADEIRGMKSNPAQQDAEKVEPQGQCAECGKRACDGWALYCVECGEIAHGQVQQGGQP